MACAAGVVANGGLVLASGGTLAPVNVLAAAAICSAVGSAVPDPTFNTDITDPGPGSFCALPLGAKKQEPDEEEGDFKEKARGGNEGNIRKGPGSIGQRKGTDALRKENRRARDAGKQLGLTDDQMKRLHRDIGGQDLTHGEIIERAREMFGL